MTSEICKKPSLNWPLAKLSDVCEINPKILNSKVDNDLDVSFLPMKAVEELTGIIYLNEERKLAEVKRGYTYFGNGDIIFAKITPCMENGKVAIVNKLKNEIGFGSTEFHVLRCSGTLLNKYLFYCLIQSSYRKLAQRNMTGTAGQLRVPKRFIENSEIPLPPLPIQQKIVQKIEQLFSELDSGVASLKKAKEQIKTYRHAVLASAFSGRLCRNLIYQIPFGEQKNFINEIPTNSSPDHLNPIQVHNLINKDDLLRVRQEVEIEHLPYKQNTNIAEERMYGIQEVTSNNKAAEPQTQYGLSQDSLDSKISSIKSEHKSSESVNHENPGSDNYANNLPEGLKWVKLGEVIDSLQYGTSEKASSNGNGIQVLRMGNIQAGKLDYSSLKYIDVSYKDLNKYLLDYGDLLFNRTNSAELVGKSALYKKHFTKSIFASYLIRVKVNKSIYSSEFLNYYINSSYGKNYLKSVVSQNVGQANVNGTKLKSMDVPLVSLSQQNQIVEEIEKRFSEADNLEKAIDDSLAKAESLRQSILKQAFEGRLV
ncbi:MAG: restriction endonuclease subunit S [Ignavibacteriaceae bacterium]